MSSLRRQTSQKLLQELFLCQNQVMMVTNCSTAALCSSITTFIQMHYSDAKCRHILSKKMQSHFQIHHVAPSQRDTRESQNMTSVKASAGPS